MPASIFRDFLYYDDRTVDSYLSAAEGGLYEEEDRRTTIDSSNPASLTENPVESSVSAQDSSRRIIRQTQAARFDRLHRYLSDEGITHVRTGGTLSLEDVPEDQFVEIKGVIQIPQLISVMVNGSRYANWGRILQTSGLVEVTDEQLNQIEMIAQTGENIGNKLTVTMDIGRQAPTVILPLRKDIAEKRFNELEGRATVLGKVTETVPKSRRYTLLQLPGAESMSRQQRRAAERSGQGALNEVRGPAVALHVIAIYR